MWEVACAVLGGLAWAYLMWVGRAAMAAVCILCTAALVTRTLRGKLRRE